MNQATLIGRLGANPECRVLPDGGMVANLRIATDESYKNQAGEKIDKTEWHRGVAYGRLAEICQDYLKKGRLIMAQGKLRTRDYMDKDGVKRYTTEIIATNIQILDKPQKAEEPAEPPAPGDPCVVTPINEIPF